MFFKSEYFTFLEFDDEMSQIWIKNGVEYIESFPKVGVFLPIIFECDDNGQFISFTNQNVWVKNVAEDTGYIDNNTLQRIQNFNFDGMIVKKDIYEEKIGYYEGTACWFIKFSDGNAIITGP